MKRMLGFILVLSACATSPDISRTPFLTSVTPASEPSHEGISDSVSPTCPGPEGVKTCGLITTVDEYNKFSKENCQGIKLKQCRKDFTNSLFAKFQLRYPKTNWNYISTWMTAYPKKSSVVPMLELEILSSHNNAIFAEAKEEIRVWNEEKRGNELREDRARKEAQFAEIQDRNARWSGALNGISESMSVNRGRSVSCVSRPDYLGGVKTTCD